MVFAELKKQYQATTIALCYSTAHYLTTTFTVSKLPLTISILTI